MDVEIRLDAQYVQPKIIICTAQMNEDLQALLEQLTENEIPFLAGEREGKMSVLDPSSLCRLYACQGKVIAQTIDQKEWKMRLRLYELEQRLDNRKFIRISNSEIVNFCEVSHFDLSMKGTIGLELKNGIHTYVSRRYVSRIKHLLGM